MLKRQLRLSDRPDPVTLDATPLGAGDLPPNGDLDDLVAALDRALLRLARTPETGSR